jgi:hypothetical protein
MPRISPAPPSHQRISMPPFPTLSLRILHLSLTCHGTSQISPSQSLCECTLGVTIATPAPRFQLHTALFDHVITGKVNVMCVHIYLVAARAAGLH